MRIGMVLECYHPTMNGVVVSVDTFARELKKRGHEVVIFVPHYPHAASEANVVRIASLGLPFNKDYRLVVERSANFTELVRRADLSVLHSHHIFTMGRLAEHAARSLGLPLVQTYHTLIAEYTHHIPLIHWLPLGQMLAKKLMIWRSRTFLNRVNHVISPSPSIGKLLRSYGVHDTIPITAIPTGIELENFTDAATDSELEHYGIDPTRPFLLFVGRLGQEKNVLRLLKTFRLIHKAEPTVQLVLIGDGPERKSYERWVQAQSWDKDHTAAVIFTGFLDKKITNRLFRRAHTFVFPSMTDTQGIVVQEALASGVPVVAVNKFGPADYNVDGTTGFLVPDSSSALANATLKIIRNPKLRSQMSQAAIRHAQQFSIEATTDRLLAVYHSLVT